MFRARAKPPALPSDDEPHEAAAHKAHNDPGDELGECRHRNLPVLDYRIPAYPCAARTGAIKGYVRRKMTTFRWTERRAVPGSGTVRS